jgi:hypothetical protein
MATPSMSCPSGGDFYACSSGSMFVGCCLTNPCATGCFQGQLEAASFEASQYGDFSDQQCSAGKFYTCIYTNENNATFWGCCQSNACSAGSCPSSDLAGAFLSNNPSEAEPYLSLNSSWVATATLSSATSSISATTSQAVTTSASSMTASSSPANAFATTSASSSSTTTFLPSSNHSTNIGAIVGGVVGGLAVVGAIILGAIFLLRRRRAASTPPMAEAHQGYGSHHVGSGSGKLEYSPDHLFT